MSAASLMLIIVLSCVFSLSRPTRFDGVPVRPTGFGKGMKQ